MVLIVMTELQASSPQSWKTPRIAEFGVMADWDINYLSLSLSERQFTLVTKVVPIGSSDHLIDVLSNKGNMISLIAFMQMKIET